MKKVRGSYPVYSGIQNKTDYFIVWAISLPFKWHCMCNFLWLQIKKKLCCDPFSFSLFVRWGLNLPNPIPWLLFWVGSLRFRSTSADASQLSFEEVITSLPKNRGVVTFFRHTFITIKICHMCGIFLCCICTKNSQVTKNVPCFHEHHRIFYSSWLLFCTCLYSFITDFAGYNQRTKHDAHVHELARGITIVKNTYF